MKPVLLLLSLASGWAAASDTDRLLDWAQQAYPSLLQKPTATALLQGYEYRCYNNAALCIGVKDGQVFLYQGGPISNIGSLTEWLRTADRDKIETGKVFPLDLAASPPTRQSAKSSFTAGPSTPLSYQAATARISALLSGSSTPVAVFDPSAFLLESNDAGCFGPTLKFTSHPDGSGSAASGTLPSGDLGIWLQTDTTTGDACAAAQLNARQDGVSMRANMALSGLAGLVRQAYASGKGLPTAGSAVDLTAEMNAVGIPSTTFSQAALQLDGASTVWTMLLNFSYTDSSGASHTIAAKLEHTPGGSKTVYSGLLTWSVTQTFNGGNCGSGANPVTRVGTLKYGRSSATAMTTSMRQGQYCGTGTYSTLGTFDADQQLKATGFSDNFSRFGASYDPVSLKGKYISVWQAGAGDGNSRILQLGLNGIGTTNDGESYFGYGDPIASTSGAIMGFNCAWAAPKPSSPVGLHKEYAQRQFINYNSSTGKWETPTAGANIRYAPTDACTYSGSSSFWYDRNLNGSNDETAADLTVTTPDLMGLGSSATIADAITARGYSIPAF